MTSQISRWFPDTPGRQDIWRNVTRGLAWFCKVLAEHAPDWTRSDESARKGPPSFKMIELGNFLFRLCLYRTLSSFHAVEKQRPIRPNSIFLDSTGLSCMPTIFSHVTAFRAQLDHKTSIREQRDIQCIPRRGNCWELRGIPCSCFKKKKKKKKKTNQLANTAFS